MLMSNIQVYVYSVVRFYSQVRVINSRKGKGLDTSYSATYISQDSCSAFTISEVAADWHEQMVPQRIMWPSIVHAN